MNTSPATIRGYVESLPRDIDPHQAHVAIIHEDIEYRILPRYAGVDLADEVNALVEVVGLVSQEEDIHYIAVRSYKLLEEDSWGDS